MIERAEARMTDILHQRISGIGPRGEALGEGGGDYKDSDHRESIQQWEQLKKNKAAEEERLRVAELEEERLRLETERQAATILVETRRLEIEAERVQIQKAEVVVKLLEVAQRGGVDGQQLLSAVLGLSDRLLPGSADLVPSRLLEVKETS
jgi:hypothetical protein